MSGHSHAAVRQRLLAVFFCLVLPWPAAGGPVLDAVKARDKLRCGVSEGIPGFSMPDALGRWQGLDADFCRAVAAAVLGDAEKVEFVPLRTSARLPALQTGKIDLLARNTTWTLGREAILQVQFPAVLLYDSQAVMVPADSDVEHVRELAGRRICLVRNTTHVRELERFAVRHALAWTTVPAEDLNAAAAALLAGQCDAMTSDAAQLAALRSVIPDGHSRFRLLPERLSKEPLAPAVTDQDWQWVSIVRWVLFALIRAEEDGVTQANVEEMVAGGRTAQFYAADPEARRLLADALGIPADWSLRAVKAVGNYGELFERHLGLGSPLRLERGLNRLWTDGGLMYAPPVD